jgi:hypothetical protein
MRCICILVWNIVIQKDTEHRVKEDEKKEESTNIGQLWQGTDECEEQDPQTFILLDDLENSKAPKCFDYNHHRAKL